MVRSKTDIARITIDLSKAEKAVLENLVKASENNQSKVLKHALFLLNKHVEMSNQGYELTYQKPNSKEKVTILFIGYDGLNPK